jgi:hypothetical protein
MLKYTVAITINASPDVVFETLTDAGTWAEWNSTVDSVEGTVALGEEVTLTSSFQVDEPMSFDLTVDELTPNESMTWSSGNFIFNGHRTFTVTDNGDGTVEFVMEENFSGLFSKGIAKSFDLTNSFDTFANDLKVEAESRMPVPEPEPEPEPEEIAVPLDELPEAVTAAILAAYEGAELVEAELEGETYDVEFNHDGTLWEAEVSADGTLGAVEEETDDDAEEDDAEDDDAEDDDADEGAE